MTTGYVFKAGAQQAISKLADGSNLPPPKLGSWEFVKKIDDINKPGLTAVDAQAIESAGYQIWSAPSGGFLADQDVLADKNVLDE